MPRQGLKQHSHLNLASRAFLFVISCFMFLHVAQPPPHSPPIQPVGVLMSRHSGEHCFFSFSRGLGEITLQAPYVARATVLSTWLTRLSKASACLICKGRENELRTAILVPFEALYYEHPQCVASHVISRQYYSSNQRYSLHPQPHFTVFLNEDSDEKKRTLPKQELKNSSHLLECG